MPKSYALWKMNISERIETEIKKCSGYVNYSPAEDHVTLLLDIIQTSKYAPTGNPSLDADGVGQTYRLMTQQFGESATTYRE